MSFCYDNTDNRILKASLNFRSNPTQAFSGFVCQGIFSPVDGATANGAITQTSPFQVTHRSGTTTGTQNGFALNYVQQGC